MGGGTAEHTPSGGGVPLSIRLVGGGGVPLSIRLVGGGGGTAEHTPSGGVPLSIRLVGGYR